MNKLDKAYTDLLQDILDNGTTKMDRTGTGTISVFGRQIRHNMKDGFPLLTTKKMPFKTIVTELLWFLRGDTSIEYLLKNDCNIWTGDAYKNYRNKASMSNDLDCLVRQEDGSFLKEMRLYTQEEFINKIKTDAEFAKKFGELGPIYGKQWRSWNERYSHWEKFGGGVPPDGVELIAFAHKGLMTRKKIKGIDQIANLINDLKTNPDSRRLMVNAWNPADLQDMVLPPCHYGFQVYTRELSWYDDLDKIKEIYVNWSLAKSSGGYAGDIKADTIESANQIFVNGWQNNKDPYTGKPLIELECFSSLPKRAISLMWNQRSCDFFIGIPFNVASYGLLLEIIAKEVNMIPDELIGNLGDVHLYSNHIEQAKEQIGRELSYGEKVEYARSLYGEEEWWNINDKRVIEILQSNKRTREPFPLPKLKINHCPITGISIDYLSISQFEVENYQSHQTIKAPLSN